MTIYDEMEILKQLFLLGIYTKKELQKYGDFYLIKLGYNEKLYFEISTCSILSDDKIIEILSSDNKYNTYVISCFIFSLFNEVILKCPESWYSVYKKMIFFIKINNLNYDNSLRIQLSEFLDDYDLRESCGEGTLNMPHGIIEFLSNYNHFNSCFLKFRKMGLSDPSDGKLFFA